MINCDNCPCLIYQENEDGKGWNECSITGYTLGSLGIYDPYWHDTYVQDEHCPLIQIELKDGTVFKPEIVGEPENTTPDIPKQNEIP